MIWFVLNTTYQVYSRKRKKKGAINLVYMNHRLAISMVFVHHVHSENKTFITLSLSANSKSLIPSSNFSTLHPSSTTANNSQQKENLSIRQKIYPIILRETTVANINPQPISRKDDGFTEDSFNPMIWGNGENYKSNGSVRKMLEKKAERQVGFKVELSPSKEGGADSPQAG
jgi:hypothetical protein